MCITIYTLYACACRHPQTILPCPMMDTALDLVDLDGVPASDPRVQRLEDQCNVKAATRYAMQARACESCCASIAEVGAAVWRVAMEKRDREVDEGWLMGARRRDDAAVAAAAGGGVVRGLSAAWDDGVGRDAGVGDVARGKDAKSGEAGLAMGAMRFLRDDLLIANSSPSSIPRGKGNITTPDQDAILYLHNSDGDVAVDPSDLGNALRGVLGHHETVRDHQIEGNIYDADDEMLDMHYSMDSGLPRSAAPSPP